MHDIHINYTSIDLFHEKGFNYSDGEFAEFDGITFHPNYEAKTFNWLKNNIDFKKEKTLLWVVGAEPKLKGEN